MAETVGIQDPYGGQGTFSLLEYPMGVVIFTGH
jgi:hypothetical protein